ncbi:MAG: aspartate-semialdehyde dehydrogenase, partial [Pseudomonadota bacterium]
VPEVNPHLLEVMPARRIFPVANCSVIQLMVALGPIHRAARIRRIVLCTYQSTSGAGRRAMEELSRQVSDLFSYREPRAEVFPHRIAFNVLPQIDRFLEDGSTGEEAKIVQETRKILEDESIGVSVTAVRVPTFHCHAEAVNVETEENLTPERAKEILKRAPGLIVVDEEKRPYPVLTDAEGRDEVYVGRIRKDPSRPNCLNLWVVADNLRKGAALNALQIIESLRGRALI